MTSKKKTTYGASLSSKLCRELEIDPLELLQAAVRELGLRRFRIMTYWSECEPEQGQYDFNGVKQLLELADQLGVEVTLCLGLRQPRWPESHPPQWLSAEGNELAELTLGYIEKTLNELKGYACITSYQLENEALNRGIGINQDYSRARLRREFELVKTLDPERPVIMSTSNSWGLPLRRPRPDQFGFSIYLHQWTRRGLSERHRLASFHAMRARLIYLLTRRQSFCHELQLEPWGPGSTQDLPDEQQSELMNPQRAEQSLELARATGLSPIDMWGLEWWYWRKQARNDPAMWEFMKKALSKN